MNIGTAMLLLVVAVLNYDVTPVDLGGGYSIDGGTITTDMPPTTITAWEILVSGPVPYTFSDTTPGAAIDNNFNVTAESITFDMTGLPGQTARFYAADNTPGDCINCIPELMWISAGFIGYVNIDYADGSPNATQNLRVPVGEVVVATSTAVPEPSAFLFLGILAIPLTLWKIRSKYHER